MQEESIQATLDPKLFQSPEEKQVGIECYISKGGPIPAVTKYLLTDFIVNEITPSGKVVTLNQKPNPGGYKQPEVEKPSYNYSNELEGEVKQVLGAEAAKAIGELYQRLESGQKITAWQHMIQNVDCSKEERLKIHNFVREKLVNIQSNTLPENKMKLKLNKKMKKLAPNARNKYIHFILFKSNIDTMSAIFRLSKLTGISQKVFSTAGLKDKRGVTTQMVSVFNSDIKSLQRFYMHAMKNRQIWIENFEEGQADNIGVGDLFGNQFGLILRLINPNDASQLEQRVQSLREVGLINYFGMQRFGSCGTKTYMIGAKIVQRKWQEVVEDLLLEDTRDETINQMKRQAYENKNYGRAERSLPNKYKIQKNLFKGLQRNGENFQNVFESMPRSIRTLYCHSLQSYIWNRIVSRRIQEYGLKVVAGDLVGKEIKGFEKLKKQVEEEKDMDKKQEAQEDVLIEEGLEQIEDQFEAFMVTEDAIANYKIEDLVMPLYGPSLTFPEGCIAYKYLIDELNSLDLSEDDFKFNSKLLCFRGQYRKVFIKPANVSFKIIKHQNPKDELQSPFYTIGDELKVDEGQRAAAQIVIQLPKSSYATMALRQLLHIPSSFETQSLLNSMYAKKEE